MRRQLEFVEQFSNLFAGRLEAFGHEAGRCVHRGPSVAAWVGHLFGAHPIGTYPVLPNNTCWWSCVDIDQDLPEAARDVAEVYSHFGIRAWTERSRSKGWHVWVFHSEPVPCAVARAAGRAAVHLVDLPSSTEVNPKQDSLPAGKLGNYVRLPYAWVDRNRGAHRKMVDLATGEMWVLPAFLDAARATRVPAVAFEALAALAPKTASRPAGAFTAAANGVLASMGEEVGHKRVFDIQAIGAVADGRARVPMGQRDTTFFTLANFLHGIGIERIEAEQIMLRVLHEQTDNDGDPFPESAVLEKVNRVYG